MVAVSGGRTFRDQYARDLGQGPVALTTDLSTLYRGVPMGPGFIQEHEGEEVFGEALFEGGEGFGEAGHGGESWPEMRSGGPYMVPKTGNTPLIEP